MTLTKIHRVLFLGTKAQNLRSISQSSTELWPKIGFDHIWQSVGMWPLTLPHACPHLKNPNNKTCNLSHGPSLDHHQIHYKYYLKASHENKIFSIYCSCLYSNLFFIEISTTTTFNYSAFSNIWSLKSGKHNQAIYINLYSDDLNEYT